MLADSSHLPSEHQTVDERDNKNEVDVYTCFKRDGDHVETYQTIREVVLPKSRGRWPLDKSPVMPLRWGGLRSEDYGRGYVDDYIGDLTAVDRLSENIRGGIAAMTKINPMVNPTGLTKARDVAKAKNLEIIAGRKDDVTMLQFEKQADLKFAGEYINSIIMRLQTAFMLNKSASRDAERVTAEEIRQVISDIDDNMGGIYSLLAGDLQKPLVLRIIYRMEKEKKIPRLSDLKGPDGKPIATPKVVTGVEALGRGHDFNKYVTLVNQIILPLKEAGLAEININDLIKRSAVSLNIDIDGLLKSSEDKKADQDAMMQVQQQKMLQDVVKGATPNVSKAMADGVATQMTDGGPDGQPV